MTKEIYYFLNFSCLKRQPSEFYLLLSVKREPAFNQKSNKSVEESEVNELSRVSNPPKTGFH